MLWLVIVLIVAMSVAVLRRGRLTNLADIRLRMWWLLPLGFAMQGIAGRIDPDIGFYLVLTSYLPLLVMMILNRDREGLWLAGVGVLMNFTVMALNGGMPVLAGAVEVASGYAASGPDLTSAAKHTDMDADTVLAFLGDVIPIRLANQGSVISIGDVFLAVGLGRFLEAELRRPVRWFKPGVKLQGGSATRGR
ncbi:MAG TPA: DUF5317 domain-containing protein [Acidimicrobiia bacterium]|nr:DUF5317 domain-containing protein [Acidimicrobiia bacterium]